MMRQDVAERRSPRSKYLNLPIWITIVLLITFIAAVTIRASHQPDRPSMWAPK